MDEQQLENRLTRLEESLDYIGEDIEELKTTQADIHNLAMSVNTLAKQPYAEVAQLINTIQAELQANQLQQQPEQQEQNE